MRHPLTATRSGPLKGRVHVPGDKSLSHRALILGALSTGPTKIQGLLEAEDVKATQRVLSQLGVDICRRKDGFEVFGRGFGGLIAPGEELDFGNSGTACRLMMGVIAGHDMTVTVTGDCSLQQRPMGRILGPLQKMGLNVVAGQGDRLPIKLIGTHDLIAIEHRLEVASAQLKSALLFAGLHANGKTTIIEPVPTRDHSERMLVFFGAELTLETRAGERVISISGGCELKGQDIEIPGDPSSAAFLAAAALLTPGSEIVIENVLTNPLRIGFYQTLIEMGARIHFSNSREIGGEPVSDIHVCASTLKGVCVPAARAPTMIDEYPCLAILAAFAEGETRMEGLSELRVKESDRLAATLEGLIRCGVDAHISGDDLFVTGQMSVPGGAHIESQMDHRIAMSFLILGLGAEAAVTVDDIAMIKTSFPEFIDLMREIGANFETTDGRAV